jgi:hypothetical protein
MEVRVGGALTVRVVLPVTLLSVAKIGADPTEFPMAKPAELIVATTVFEETQVT